jgi:Tfp pilus assembly protein PilF
MYSKTIIALMFVLALSACATSPTETISAFVQGKGSPALAAGVQQFENGQYADAAKTLQTALDLGLNSSGDRARAHKYLAFMHCASNRLTQCREQFSRALEASPQLELEPSEVGHPIWGPAFKQVKAKR